MFYLFYEVEKVFHETMSNQVHEELVRMNSSLEELMDIVMKTVILLEQDSVVENIMKEPEQYGLLERQYIIEDKLKGINNSLFLNQSKIYFTMIDFKGNVYASFTPRTPLEYSELVEQKWYLNLRHQSDDSYHWVPSDENYVHPDISTSQKLVTLHALLKDSHYKPFGVARISIDYTYWFNSMVKNSQIEQDYFIVADGQIISEATNSSPIDEEIITIITSGGNGNGDGYFIDRRNNSVVNFNHIPRLNWYLVNRVDLSVFFQEINRLKGSLFIVSGIFIGLFIVITFAISSKVTSPLRQLQEKMYDFSNNGQKVFIPEEKYQGEMLTLTRTFNTMVQDMNVLIDQLRMEERQKQAIQFQMLLSQTNPHFLLNTLTTIKWIAIKNGNQEIKDICISLGKLLENSLNSEVDLIPWKAELELVKAYVYIQQYRFNEMFEVIYESDSAFDYALVPKLSIQPLVENAIYHAFQGLQQKGSLVIRIYSKEDYVYVEVDDNGIGFEAAKKKKQTRQRKGIGIQNVKERLRLLFKDEGIFHVIPLKEGTRIQMIFPLLMAKPYQ